MQPYIFPYIGYFSLIDAVDTLVFFDDVNFIKKGWINRNKIQINDMEYTFTIPLQKASQNRKIMEIDIVSENKWRKTLSRSINDSYRRAPMFDEVFPVVNTIIMSSTQKISELAIASIHLVLDYLNIKKDCVKSSEIEYWNAGDGQDKILSICDALDANTYINPISGGHLYDNAKFESRTIDLKLLDTLPQQPYGLTHKPFISGLSIIDILMYKDKSDILDAISRYQLK